MHTTRMKHMGSSAADLPISYEIDEGESKIEMQADWFDSDLIANFFHDLHRKRGITAFRDDRDWSPPPPPYRAFLTMRGQRYEVTMHLLPETGKMKGNSTVVLRPL